MAERWITWKGRHLLVDDDGKIVNYNKDQIKNKYKNAKKISELEYDVMSEEFAETLTDEEKKEIYYYGVGGVASYDLNNPQHREFERTYRFSDNKGGFVEKKLSYLEAINTKLDEKATNIKTKDTNWDENIKFNYEATMRSKNSLKKMDNIFNKKGIVLDKDIILYRKGYETAEDFQKNYTRYGYTSTSIKSRINKNTPGGLKLGSNEFEIIVPKGTKILPIKNVVPEDVKYQNEVLLPRNLNFTLVEDKSTPGGWNKEKLDFDKKKNKYLVVVNEE